MGLRLGLQGQDTFCGERAPDIFLQLLSIKVGVKVGVIGLRLELWG